MPRDERRRRGAAPTVTETPPPQTAQPAAVQLADAGIAQALDRSHAEDSPYRRTISSPMPVKVQELLARLEADGWFQVRHKGSHRQFHHPSKVGTVTVAGKPSVEVPSGTLNNILKQAGLRK
jgi:predicted RNA binding protein YcfA (HicA-like mRNA interferase family)